MRSDTPGRTPGTTEPASGPARQAPQGSSQRHPRGQGPRLRRRMPWTEHDRRSCVVDDCATLFRSPSHRAHFVGDRPTIAYPLRTGPDDPKRGTRLLVSNRIERVTHAALEHDWAASPGAWAHSGVAHTWQNRDSVDRNTSTQAERDSVGEAPLSTPRRLQPDRNRAVGARGLPRRRVGRVPLSPKGPEVVRRAGFEPATYRFVVCRSIQLS